MTEIKYLLIPTWRFYNGDILDFDIPPYFMKMFSTKKEIENYMNSNDISRELREIKDKELYEKIERNNLTGDEKIKAMAHSLDYDLSFWVIGVNSIGKENRIGIMQHEYDREKKCLIWKYRSYFGGKVWKDQLLFGIYR
jgi:hypothetical protein